MLLFHRPSELLTTIGRSNRQGSYSYILTSHYFLFFAFSYDREKPKVLAQNVLEHGCFFFSLHLPADRQYVIDQHIKHFGEMS